MVLLRTVVVKEEEEEEAEEEEEEFLRSLLGARALPTSLSNESSEESH